SGRTSNTRGVFDFGYTIVKKENVDTFSKRFKDIVSLEEVSKLDLGLEDISVDQRDLAESIKEGTFDVDLHLPEVQIDRIKDANLDNEIKYILNNLLVNDKPITGAEYYALKNSTRTRIKTNFKKIYSHHLRRTKLNKAE
ncbi:helicase, partial [Vibrio parahaemolyticus]